MVKIEGDDKTNSTGRTKEVFTAGQLADQRSGTAVLDIGDATIIRSNQTESKNSEDLDKLVPPDESEAASPMEDDTV